MFEPSADFITGSVPLTAAVWSYGIAAAAYLVFALRIAMDSEKSARSTLLLAAVAMTTLWGASGAFVVLHPAPTTWLAGDAADIVRYLLWIFFLGTLIINAVDAAGRERARYALSQVSVG